MSPKRRKKGCLSAQEMNQFAGMNHHTDFRNSLGNCSSSWLFVAQMSFAACCLTRTAQLRGGTKLSARRVDRSCRILTRPDRLPLRVNQECLWNQRSELLIWLRKIMKSEEEEAGPEKRKRWRALKRALCSDGFGP